MNQTLTHALYALELRLLDPSIRRNRAAVGALLAEEFHEFGRSGRAYGRAEILDLLAGEPVRATPVGLEEFRAEPLGEAAALVTYRSTHADGEARRSSVWIWREGRWQMLFHQATAAAE